MILGLGLGTERAGGATNLRCGGDGPQPFFDLSDEPTARPIALGGAIEEFQYWERQDTIVYRNDRHQIRARKINSTTDQYLGTSQVPLSPLVDPDEQNLLLDGISSVFNNNFWYSFYLPVGRPKHLFWDLNYLYMLNAIPATGPYSQELQIHRYRLGLKHTRHLCHYYVPVGEEYALAEGASFPIVPFYRVRKGLAGKELSILEMDARTCNVTEYGTYKESFDSKILSVHRFADLRSYAVHMDHPTKNLFWDYGTGCQYYNVGTSPLLVPSHSRPIVGTWGATGLELMNLTSRNRGNYFPPAKGTTLRPRDVVMGARNDRLLIAPDTNKTNGKQLYELDVKDVTR